MKIVGNIKAAISSDEIWFILKSFDSVNSVKLIFWNDSGQENKGSIWLPSRFNLRLPALLDFEHAKEMRRWIKFQFCTVKKKTIEMVCLFQKFAIKSLYFGTLARFLFYFRPFARFYIWRVNLHAPRVLVQIVDPRRQVIHLKGGVCASIKRINSSSSMFHGLSWWN